MDLLIIRHGHAEPRGDSGGDASRRLTEDGRKKLRRGVKGLRKLVPELDALVSSPLVRAVETAAIVAEAYGGLAVEETPCLEPEREPKELGDWLALAPGRRSRSSATSRSSRMRPAGSWRAFATPSSSSSRAARAC